jgi:hypothetical protein
MYRFSKRLGKFLVDRHSQTTKRFLRQETAQLKNNLSIEGELSFYSTPVASVDSISPGDIAAFKYSNTRKYYITLAVSNKRSGINSSRFSRNNQEYFSAFTIDHLSKETWGVIVKSINKYKDSFNKVASYDYIKRLFGIFIGPQYYRTFISVGTMSGLTRIDLEEVIQDGKSSNYTR